MSCGHYKKDKHHSHHHHHGHHGHHHHGHCRCHSGHGNCHCGCQQNQCRCGEGGGDRCGCSGGSGCRCGGGQGSFRRHFTSKAERIEGLERYLKELKAEAEAVKERIAELKAD